MTTTILPAAAGAMLLLIEHAGKHRPRFAEDPRPETIPDGALWRVPVIGWRVIVKANDEFDTEPVTAFRWDESEFYWFIEGPDGQYFTTWQRYASLDYVKKMCSIWWRDDWDAAQDRVVAAKTAAVVARMKSEPVQSARRF